MRSAVLLKGLLLCLNLFNGVTIASPAGSVQGRSETQSVNSVDVEKSVVRSTVDGQDAAAAEQSLSVLTSRQVQSLPRLKRIVQWHPYSWTFSYYTERVNGSPFMQIKLENYWGVTDATATILESKIVASSYIQWVLNAFIRLTGKVIKNGKTHYVDMYFKMDFRGTGASNGTPKQLTFETFTWGAYCYYDTVQVGNGPCFIYSGPVS